MKTIKKFMEENLLLEQRSDLVTLSLKCSASAAEESLIPLLEYIAKNGNTGHSFEIVVDPDDKERRKTFGYDGDGSDYIDIKSIKVEK